MPRPARNGRWSVWLRRNSTKPDLRVQHADYGRLPFSCGPREESTSRAIEGCTASHACAWHFCEWHDPRQGGEPDCGRAGSAAHLVFEKRGGPEPNGECPIEDRYSARTKPDGSFTVTGLPRRAETANQRRRLCAYILALDIKPEHAGGQRRAGRRRHIDGRIVDVEASDPRHPSSTFGMATRPAYSLSLRAHADGRRALRAAPRADGCAIEFSLG